MTPIATVARAMFAAAVSAVQPDRALRRLAFAGDGVSLGDVEVRPPGRLVLLALGKAAPGLATGFVRRARRLPDSVFALAPDGVEADAAVAPFVRRASHPTPDARGEEATRELLALLSSLSPADGVVLLLSGGASSLLALPLPGVARERVTAVTGALLAAGATIRELNTLRKHLLAATGGRLAAACAAPLLTLALSDVPGDDLATIASGPSVPDETTNADARQVLARRGVAATFADLDAYLAARDAAGQESVKPGDPRLARSHAAVLAGSAEALAAAGEVARDAGLNPVILTRRLRGEAREVGTALAALARTTSEGAALLLAGETTVTVRGGGRGGRNLEVALAAAVGLPEGGPACVLAAGTDGVDGSSPAAGAVVDGGTVTRGAQRGRNAAEDLAANDSWGFFADAEEAILTGPTGTNVADVAFVLGMGQPRDFVPPDVVLAETGAHPTLRGRPGRP